MTVNDHDFMERLWSLEGDVTVFQFKLYQSCVKAFWKVETFTEVNSSNKTEPCKEYSRK